MAIIYEHKLLTLQLNKIMSTIFDNIALITRINKAIQNSKKTPLQPPPKDKKVASEILDVFAGPDGKGMFMKLEGHPYPFPGYPAGDVVQVLETTKRMFLIGLEIYYPILEKYFLKPEAYSKPTREIYRLFDILIAREKSKSMKEKFEKIRNMASFILEYDSAYRFRFQDILSEIDLSQIRLDSAEEYYFKGRDDYDCKHLNKK